MGSRRGKKVVTQLSEKSDTENSLNDSNLHASVHQQKRRSKRITEKQNVSKEQAEISLNVSIHDVSKQHNLLRKPIMEAFNYDVQEQDVYYLQDFFVELPKLKDVWKRIGFNSDIQERRLETLYEKLIETFHDIIESEEDLETQILTSIEEQRQAINELCIEMSIKPSELKLKKAKSVLEEDDILRAELKSLEAEKFKRLDEYNKLVIIENRFSQKLCIDPYEKRTTVPSQKMLNDLSSRIEELQELCQQRREEMAVMKEEIMRFSEDLELSRSDSFAELLIMESIDDVPLGDEDLKRTQEFRDELRQKDTVMTNEIRSLRLKIRELWTKLSIGNESINELVMGNDFPDTKRNMVGVLREEHDACVQVKMANMQKFIESVRVEIRALLTKMLTGPKELKKIEQELLSLTDYTEELLTRHEQKKEELEFVYEESHTLYEKAAKWIELWTSFIEFEEKTKDPARFKVRGYNMLAEEKQRKAFNSQLPKLEEDLNVHAREFAETGDQKEFTIYGLFFSEYIQRKKQDHEESKMNERKEKQIMRDNLKRNESRFGSKPITPLAIRNKRKLLGAHHESTISTPGRVKNPKLLKTDETPGTSVLGMSRMGSAKPGTARSVMQPKLSVAAKRKSKTPAKNRFRKSRGPLQFDTAANETIKDKTAVSAASSCSYQTINSTVNSNSSRLTNLATSRITRQTASVKVNKPPPQSSSAKFAAASQRIDTLQVMHSTASNTFIEEEDFDNLENGENTVLSSNKEPIVSKPKSAHLKKADGITGISKFNFEHPESSKYQNKFASQEIGYSEFSRDLVQMRADVKANMSRFGGSILSDQTNSSTLSLKYTSSRLAKPQLSTLRIQDEKDKLTSTLLSSN